MLFQLHHQVGGFLVGAVQRVHDFLHREDNVDLVLCVQPVVFQRQAHAIKQDAVQHFGVGGHLPQGRLGEQRLGDAVKGELLGLSAVKIIVLLHIASSA